MLRAATARRARCLRRGRAKADDRGERAVGEEHDSAAHRPFVVVREQERALIGSRTTPTRPLELDGRVSCLRGDD
jgi:hypothetical protein